MANRLANETSPYLLQHKDNPVEWYPWGDDALARAREQERPILLSIGYSACHWCHVMERESFEDPETAAYMNEHFVPIKVDREERPDVDALYMEAVQGMTGHGGWPLTAFLDPDGVPFYGGTYFPPEPRPGLPSFRQAMEAVVEAWDTRREQIRAAAPRTRDQLGAVGRIEPSREFLSEDLLDRAVDGLRGSADMEHGGFGSAPKFPPASALELLLARGVTDAVEVTLDAMAAGGIHDHVGGGFARYSVDDVWLVPHFEKMLYDNGLLARAYLHGWQVLGHDRYRRVCETTLDWALREMRGPEGGFYSALDADSEGEEGRFYVWTPDEIADALRDAGLDDHVDDALARYGVTEGGNFEGRDILHLPAGLEDEPPGWVADARRALYERRSQRVWPGLDDKRLASWNALMLSALAEAGAVLGRADYLEAATRAAEFVERQLRDERGRLLRSYKDGQARIPAYLEDHAYLVEALLTLYEASFEQRWFDAARATADDMIARFADPERGGFFTTADDGERLIARRKDVDDHPIPSGSSSAAFGLLRLAALTGEHGYARHAEGVLRLFHGVAARHPQAVAHLLRALSFHLSPGREVALVAPAEAATDALSDLAKVVRAAHRPNFVVAGGREGTEAPELMRERHAVEGKAAAYVCESFACRAPVTDPAELAQALSDR
ncbi:MAG TPA: thioredoxin domain-containing protein [Solirubrobacterales bacterium]|nr:thioredoxin domain-containing protein [Solirubrobacterales bacterium]